jgi:hypothetical protein
MGDILFPDGLRAHHAFRNGGILPTGQERITRSGMIQLSTESETTAQSISVSDALRGWKMGARQAGQALNSEAMCHNVP